MSDYIEFRIRNRMPSQRGHKVLGGLRYNVWVRWNGYTETWYADITQITDPSISLKGLALLPGKDLLGSHGYQHVLGELWVEDTAGTNDNPTYEGLGDRWVLRYYPGLR